MAKLSFYDDSQKKSSHVQRIQNWDKSQFIHPDDQSAMNAFQQIPGADAIMRLISSGIAEKSLLGICYAQNVRINENQFPEVFSLLPPVCEKLKLGIKTPTMFVETNPVPNAYTYGVNDVVLVVTSGLLNDLTSDEVQAVIAHECGHIVCEHSLYLTACALLRMVGGTVLPGIVMEPIKIALAYWSRMAEFSADRVSPLVVEQALLERSLIRMSGMPKHIADNINMDEYMNQVAEYDRRFERSMDKTLLNLHIAYQSHPYTVNRVRELRKWISSLTFQRLSKQLGK